MHPKQHLIYGTIFSIACYFLFSEIGILGAFIIWISSWFIIDLDHPLLYTIKKKDINPKRFWIWSVERTKKIKRLSKKEKKELKSPVIIFHGIESIIILFILAYFYSIVYFVIIGFLLHLILDSYDLYIRGMDLFDKVSVIFILLKNRTKTVDI